MTGGQRLPAIRELAKTLRVSPVTVAAAYRLLRTRGLAVGDGRRGTVLRAQWPKEVRWIALSENEQVGDALSADGARPETR
jgi:DNA-binding transcriptional regulator YhcF (GntR family)